MDISEMDPGLRSTVEAVIGRRAEGIYFDLTLDETPKIVSKTRHDILDITGPRLKNFPDFEESASDLAIGLGEVLTNAYKYRCPGGEAYAACCDMPDDRLAIVVVNSCQTYNPEITDIYDVHGRGVGILLSLVERHNYMKAFPDFPEQGMGGRAVVTIAIGN